MPETCRNQTILIVVVLCQRAKALGKQYCKRTLPPFVTPYCVIRRDLVLDYLKRHPSGAVCYLDGLWRLGALDRRTIRRHVADGVALIRRALIEIVEVLAQAALVATIPKRRVRDTELDYLQRASGEFTSACHRVHGAGVPNLPPLYFVSLCGVWSRWRTPPEVSTTFVLRWIIFHDTG